MTQYNPFIHGYTDFRIERTLQITYEDDCPLLSRVASIAANPLRYSTTVLSMHLQ